MDGTILVEVAMSSSVHTPTKILLLYHPVQILANTQFPFTHFLHPPVNTSMTVFIIIIVVVVVLLFFTIIVIITVI